MTREAVHNVALRVEDTAEGDQWAVSGRGELHLAVLLETMRREAYELAVSRPRVIVKEIDGRREEPIEALAVDIEQNHQGALMEALGSRGGGLQTMQPSGQGRVRLDYSIPARGLIGFLTEFQTITSGTGLLHHVFDHYGPVASSNLAQRKNGALVSNGTGKVLAYALFNLQERGILFIAPGDEVYEGQVIGLHNRDNDLVVNPLKAKKLTNIRAAGRDENIILSPPAVLTLESAMELIRDDELVEITPEGNAIFIGGNNGHGKTSRSVRVQVRQEAFEEDAKPESEGHNNADHANEQGKPRHQD